MFRLAAVALTDPIGGLDQPRQFGCRVVCRDPTGTMPEQILSILEADTGGTQGPPERVFQVMDPNLGQVRPLARPDPTRREHAANWSALVRENVSWMTAAARLDHRAGPGCLNRFSASISGASAGVGLPSGGAAG